MTRLNTKACALVLCTAMAGVLLAGCTTQGKVADAGLAPVGQVASDGSFDTAFGPALAKAEARAAKAPRNGAVRSDLAQVYLSQGRFVSAATTFEDAISLGEKNPRTGLGLALAYAGAGRNAEAQAVLERWQDQIPVSDYGLALAITGRPADAVDVLTRLIRGGQSTARARQNLAYAYALDGRWGQARVIAGQDVPADQLDARLSEWASRARPDQGQLRVAALLGAPLRSDPGQPAALALNDVSRAPAVAVAAAAAEPASELPAVHSGESFWGANQPQDDAPAATQTPAAPSLPAFASASAAPHKPVGKFVRQPAAKPVPVASRSFADTFGEISASDKPSARPVARSGTHLVQLGAFSSRQRAERAKAVFVARNSTLKTHTLRITEAQVNGQRFFRVAAEGFNGGSARSLCGSVKRQGNGCFAYAEKAGLPGAVPSVRAKGPQFAER